MMVDIADEDLLPRMSMLLSPSSDIQPNTPPVESVSLKVSRTAFLYDYFISVCVKRSEDLNL